MGGRFNFWAKDGKAVMFMTETQIKAQEAKDFKDRQAKRARAKVHENDNNAIEGDCTPLTKDAVSCRI